MGTDLRRLNKLLEGEIKAHGRTNVVKSRAFSEMLDEALSRYRNCAVTILEVIEELIKMAKRVREDRERGTEPGLTPLEVAFYDALADDQSAKDLLGPLRKYNYQPEAQEKATETVLKQAESLVRSGRRRDCMGKNCDYENTRTQECRRVRKLGMATGQ